MERFLDNFRAIKQSSSQQTCLFFFWSVVLKFENFNRMRLILFVKIDTYIFRVLGPILPILSARKPPKLNIHFGYLPPPATLFLDQKKKSLLPFSLTKTSKI